MSTARCEGCGEYSFLLPLHGGKGGPLRCPLCVGKWNAEHGKRRRHGRIVIRALRAYLDNGGRIGDIEKLEQSAICSDFLGEELFGTEVADPLGYLDGVATNAKGEIIELTSELLADAIKLAHPDHHPPERQDLAHRVTQGLLALQPFVFSAPKPKKPLFDPASEPTPQKSKPKHDVRYPCPDCADTTPYFYCDACKAEYEKREHKKDEQRRAKQRASYKRRRQRVLAWRSPRHCKACGGEFKSSRSDARFCSAICRQKAHRAAVVTDKHQPPVEKITNCDKFGRDILELLARYPAVFLNDLLPEKRTRAQYQALCLAAARLEEAGKIGSWSYWVRWDKPGDKVLVRPGYEIKNDTQVQRLKSDERISVA